MDNLKDLILTKNKLKDRIYILSEKISEILSNQEVKIGKYYELNSIDFKDIKTYIYLIDRNTMIFIQSNSGKIKIDLTSFEEEIKKICVIREITKFDFIEFYNECLKIIETNLFKENLKNYENKT